MSKKYSVGSKITFTGFRTRGGRKGIEKATGVSGKVLKRGKVLLAQGMKGGKKFNRILGRA